MDSGSPLGSEPAGVLTRSDPTMATWPSLGTTRILLSLPTRVALLRADGEPLRQQTGIFGRHSL